MEIRDYINSQFKKLKGRIKETFPSIFYGHKAYSQDGEDMILKAFFDKEQIDKGFYVDVGAHHPFRHSNTKYFYSKGWRGINIDATPGSMKKFRKFRKRDINLELAISDNKNTLIFYMFNEPALNTFDKNISINRDGLNNYRIIEKKEIITNTLFNVLQKHLPKNQEIDFLSIDVEGFDYNVLLSNNWKKYKPRYILIEGELEMNKIENNKIYMFLIDKGYNLSCKTIRTEIYKRVKS